MNMYCYSLKDFFLFQIPYGAIYEDWVYLNKPPKRCINVYVHCASIY